MALSLLVLEFLFFLARVKSSDIEELVELGLKLRVVVLVPDSASDVLVLAPHSTDLRACERSQL